MDVDEGRKGDWLETYSGIAFWPLDPRPGEVEVEDIAHALSNQCRFSGHCRRFYSVAEHSVSVSLLCDPADALWGLLHDASEAYLVDLPRPLKRLEGFAAYRDAEVAVMAAVLCRFGLETSSPVEMPPSVKRADEVMLRAEAAALIGRRGVGPRGGWHLRYGEDDARAAGMVRCEGPMYAKARFMSRFYELTR